MLKMLLHKSMNMFNLHISLQHISIWVKSSTCKSHLITIWQLSSLQSCNFADFMFKFLQFIFIYKLFSAYRWKYFCHYRIGIWFKERW